MRVFLLAAVSTALVSCSNARAANLDSSNPAQCLAAFNYDAYWFKVGNEPDKVAEYLARGLYVMGKAKAEGHSPAAVLAEAKEFSALHVKDSKAMDALSISCGKALSAD